MDIRYGRGGIGRPDAIESVEAWSKTMDDCLTRSEYDRVGFSSKHMASAWNWFDYAQDTPLAPFVLIIS
jgi:hypothetical protein